MYIVLLVRWFNLKWILQDEIEKGEKKFGQLRIQDGRIL